jgi:hypothetical protein
MAHIRMSFLHLYSVKKRMSGSSLIVYRGQAGNTEPVWRHLNFSQMNFLEEILNQDRMKHRIADRHICDYVGENKLFPP